MIHLKSNNLEASIHPKGAELQGLKHTGYGIEYMWQGNAAYWGKHSPVLFPIVGTLKDDTYFYNNQSYSLPRHGFARDFLFDAEQNADDAAIFTLKSNEEMAVAYPFDFQLQLHYQLSDHGLSCKYAVKNTGKKALFFSIGGHPAFNVPLVAGTSYLDHYLQFEIDEPLMRNKLENGLLSADTEPVNAVGGRLSLHPALFYGDAIVLKHMHSHRVTLASTAHPHGLHFHYDGFPYLGIWAAKDAPFVCIEPWCGHADYTHHNQQLTEKEGIVKLPAGEGWSRVWKIECF